MTTTPEAASAAYDLERVEAALYNVGNDHDPTAAVLALLADARTEAHRAGHGEGVVEALTVFGSMVDTWARNAPPQRTPQAHAVLDCEREVRTTMNRVAIDHAVEMPVSPSVDPSRRDVYVVQTPQGFSESFNRSTINTLLNLGLIRHVEDRHVLEDGQGRGLGSLHHFYESTGMTRG